MVTLSDDTLRVKFDDSYRMDLLGMELRNSLFSFKPLKVGGVQVVNYLP